MLKIEQNMIVEVEVKVPATESATTRAVDLEVFECPSCCGALGIDSSYLEQQTTAIVCPYCKAILDVTPDDEETGD